MTVAHPFTLAEVDLQHGVHARARDQMLHLAGEYPADRLLAVFRANAKLDTRGAQPPGNWEHFGHPDEQAWNEHDYPGAGAPTANLLRGHYAGHFLSMLSMAYASTGEEALRDKAYELVAGLAEVQRALAATGRFSHPGFLAAYGEWQFSRLEQLAPYGEIWAPWYTTHKILAGLLDAHEHAGSPQALQVAIAMGHWVAARILPLERAQLQRMWSLYIAGEFGGMNESLVALHRLTGDATFLRVASAFELDALLDAAVAGRDVLDGRHANQHLPMLVGHLDQFEATGERRYLDAVLGIWEQLVPGRVFAHGGTGEGELWGPAGTVAGFVGRRNAETCATYNLLKVARRLFALTGEGRFASYAERAQLNHIVGSRADVLSSTSPEVLYMYPVDPGAVREYGNVGTCCGGTGLESHVKHQESVYFASGRTLWVNQYVPSRVRWEGVGAVELLTRYPRSGFVELRVDVRGALTMLLRVPSHAVELRVSVNGSVWPVAVTDGYVRISRDFSPGDTVTVAIPLPLRLVPAVDDPALVSVELGPTVLLARSEATTPLPIAPAAHRKLDGTLTGHTRSGDTVTAFGLDFEPAWSGGTARYHLYLRVDDPVIDFLDAPSGVPHRTGADGWSFLRALWSGGGFPSVAAFHEAVQSCAVRAARTGLLSRDEVTTVLAAAAASSLSAGVPPAWELPADLGSGDVPPAVQITVSGVPAPSGWHTTLPIFTVNGDFSLDDGPWQPLAPGEHLPFPGEGRFTLRARSTSPSGTSHARREIAIDTTPPSVRATVRPLGPSAVEITLHADDAVSGVDRIQWRTGSSFWALFQEAFPVALTPDPQTLSFTATDRAGNTSPVATVILPATT